MSDRESRRIALRHAHRSELSDGNSALLVVPGLRSLHWDGAPQQQKPDGVPEAPPGYPGHNLDDIRHELPSWNSDCTVLQSATTGAG
ncbi:hypothetical protein RB196_10770 [Streptomyces sp. PmtA]|uniref:hypothetical protein n=1 Tax=Streptomyces sp. PmtA TaxID=3074275 RepID=UPI003014DEF6